MRHPSILLLPGVCFIIYIVCHTRFLDLTYITAYAACRTCDSDYTLVALHSYMWFQPFTMLEKFWNGFKMFRIHTHQINLQTSQSLVISVDRELYFFCSIVCPLSWAVVFLGDAGNGLLPHALVSFRCLWLVNMTWTCALTICWVRLLMAREAIKD